MAANRVVVPCRLWSWGHGSNAPLTVESGNTTESKGVRNGIELRRK
jgi:hypothetical protein